jgi:group I intron endonuclease
MSNYSKCNLSDIYNKKILDMIGTIYKYTDPNGKSYIGQTVSEERRRKEFYDLRIKYAGDKINTARAEIGPENFQYEILEQKEYKNTVDAILDLNVKESYYIGKYDTYQNGYNMTTGGEGVRGIVFTDEIKEKISNTLKEYFKTHDNPFKGQKHKKETIEILREQAKNRPSPFKGKHWSEEERKRISERMKLYTKGELNGFYGKKHSDKTKKIISDANSKPVKQIDAKTGEVINRFKSAKEAGISLGKPKGNSEIIKVCKKYISPSGRHYKTALGYKWEYDEFEGSTTTETTEM